ncbi:hypothetical protein BH10PSE17_BH10PSE17_14850 [soil metagenome]
MPTRSARSDRISTRLLRGTATTGFVAVATGQLAFAASVAIFYGRVVLRGDWLAMNSSMEHGWLPDQPFGNAAVVLHLAIAVLILVSGALQLVPTLRSRAPRFHRWNGRVYLSAAVLISLGGLYMVWIRGAVGDFPQHVASTLNAVLILWFGTLALRRALAREFVTHRRWALRLYMVVGGVWFFRFGLMLTLALAGGPIGFDPVTFSGPTLWVIAFGAYLLPLLMLEIYLLAQRREATNLMRGATAASIAVLTLAMVAGTGAAAASMWLPRLQPAFGEQASIAEAMSIVVRTDGIDKAEQFYRTARLDSPPAYSFAERELNSLGYQLLRGKRHVDAIRIFGLNAEVFPASSNVWDSLAEACLTAGDAAQARIHYQRAVELNPQNTGAARALDRLRE